MDVRRNCLAATAVLGVGLLAACGSGTAATTASSSPAAAARGNGGNGGGGFGGGTGQPPGALGLVAALSPGSLEVQDPTTGQTTVTYTSGTTFTQTVTVPESALKAGDCVTAVAARPSSSSASPSAPAAGTPQTITATTVVISAPVNGSCARGLGAQRPRPSGTRTRTPGSGRPGGGFGGFGGVVSGAVTSVSPTAIGVRATDRQTGAAVSDTVEVTAATTYTETQAATSGALKLGVCVTATGTTSPNGAVSAKRIGISPAVNSACSTGFGGRGRFGGGGGGGGTTGNA